MPRPLQVDLSTLKVGSKPRATSATSVPILVFLGLSDLDLDQIYVTDGRQTDVRRAASLNPCALWGIIIVIVITVMCEMCM